MTLEGLALGAKIKGLNLLGTGDITFPLWIENLKSKLEEINNSGIFVYDDIYFILTGEVNTIFQFQGKTRQVHHVFHLPSFEVAEQVNEQLSKYGNLSIDGRPSLRIGAPEFVEIVMEISNDNFVYSSHNWTPFFGCMGQRAGFNSLEECYQDQIKHIYALETGMSSDPSMNFRLSCLDKFTLLSSSDSHSPNPWRLGREANVFDLKNLTYREMHNAIKNKDRKRFLYTIEVDPNYGRYHFDGHRQCNISLTPKEAMKLNNICPKCRRKLTLGVLHRVEQLADREEGFVPKNAIPFKTLLPLYEIISYVTGIKKLYNKRVLAEQDRLITEFGNEFHILLDLSKEELARVTNEKIADAIIKAREGKLEFIPGYDGVYGEPVFEKGKLKEFFEKQEKTIKEQKSLRDFKGP